MKESIKMYKYLFIGLVILLASCKKTHDITPGTDAAKTLLPSNQEALNIKGNAYFFGDSITEGLTAGGVVDSNWVALVSKFTGLNGRNLGISGTTLEEKINGIPSLQSMYSRCTTEVPVKAANDKYLFFAYGMNDVGYNYSDLNANQFKSDYDYVLKDAFKKGWKSADIIILNIYYCNEAGFSIYNVDPVANRERQNLFNDAIKSIAVSNGTRFIDVYSFMQNNGGTALICPDGIHPNNDGYAVIARCVEEALRRFQ
jgi:lysophospholipase L1-like esterase